MSRTFIGWTGLTFAGADNNPLQDVILPHLAAELGTRGRLGSRLQTRRSALQRVGGLLVVCVLSACGGKRPPVDEFVRQYVRLAVALGERDPDSLDYYYGPPEWVADIRSNPPRLEEIKRSASSLRRLMKTEFLRGQLRAIEARADLLIKVHLSFDEEARALFGYSGFVPENSTSLADVRAKLNRLLPGSASLADRYLG